MSTHISYTKSGLTLTFDKSDVPVPRIVSDYPYPEINQNANILTVATENIFQSGRIGIRITSVDDLSSTAGPTATWGVHYSGLQTAYGSVPFEGDIPVKNWPIDLLLADALPSANYSFYLWRVANPGGPRTEWALTTLSSVTPDDSTLGVIANMLSDDVLNKGHEKFLMQIDWAAAESAYVEIVQQAAQVFNQSHGNGAPEGTYADGSTWGYSEIAGYTYDHPGDVPYEKDIPGPPEAQQLRYAFLDLYFVRDLWTDASVNTPCSEQVVHDLYPSQYELLNALFVGGGGLWVQGYAPKVAGRPTLYERWQQFYTCLDLLRVNIRYRTAPLPVDWVLNAVKNFVTPHPMDPIKGEGGKTKPPTAGNSYNAAEWTLAFGSKDWPTDIHTVSTTSGAPALINLYGYAAGTRWVITSNSTYYTAVVGSQRISSSANSNFNSSDNWVKGSGWSISNYQLRHTPGGGTSAASLGSAYSGGFTVGNAYRVVFDLNQISDQWGTSEGLGLAFAGFTASGLKNSTSGSKTYTFDYVATGTGDLTFTPTGGWDGAVGNIFITELTWAGPTAVPPPVVGQIFINCDYLYPGDL